MGLDNYATQASGEELTDEDVAAFEAEGPNLCGGIASGDAGSFRGKVYVGLIQDITGESLYEPFIPPERVKAMYNALRDCDPSDSDNYDCRFGEPEDQIDELRKFFKVCAERNLGIVSWW
jgi:hypothetical protein